MFIRVSVAFMARVLDWIVRFGASLRLFVGSLSPRTLRRGSRQWRNTLRIIWIIRTRDIAITVNDRRADSAGLFSSRIAQDAVGKRCQRISSHLDSTLSPRSRIEATSSRRLIAQHLHSSGDCRRNRAVNH